MITIEPVDLVRGPEVSDLFSRYRFRGVVHTAQAHQHARTRAESRANYDMAFNCLEAAQASGVDRFILVSSLIVYAGLGAPLSEDKRFPVQVTVEDRSDGFFTMPGADGDRLLTVPTFEVALKRALETIALDYATPMQMGLSAEGRDGQKPTEKPLDVAVLRISTEFGPGYTQMGSPLSRAVHTVAGKGDLMTGTGYMGIPLLDLWNLIAMSPLTYVRDTANALVRIMQTETLPRRIYNLSSGFTTSPREQLQALNRVRPEAGELLKIDPDALREEPYPTYGFGSDLLAKDTAWSPEYSFEAALEDYIGWLQQHPY
ncbi:NAD(P)-dependent oxidoreductase [Streptomyces canus]|uniref:NAD-dependent epimerase/dehydratase family protein n=1 Tax=Streptomyces canus TaxID=58343 RepID=UPI0033CFCB69